MIVSCGRFGDKPLKVPTRDTAENGETDRGYLVSVRITVQFLAGSRAENVFIAERYFQLENIFQAEKNSLGSRAENVTPRSLLPISCRQQR